MATALSSGRALRVSVRHTQQARGTGTVVIGAVIHVMSVGHGSAQSNMVQVRAHDDVFILEHGIAAFQNADHVFGMPLLAMHREVDRQLLGGIELERIELGVVVRRAERLRSRDLLALEQRIGESHSDGHVGRCRAGRRWTEFRRGIRRSVQSSATAAASAGIGISHGSRCLEVGNRHYRQSAVLVGVLHGRPVILAGFAQRIAGSRAAAAPSSAGRLGFRHFLGQARYHHDLPFQVNALVGIVAGLRDYISVAGENQIAADVEAI